MPEYTLTPEERKKLAQAILDGCEIGISITPARPTTELGTPAKPPTHMWECPYMRGGTAIPRCGLPLDKCGGREDSGLPCGWHERCWSAYQIKTLREMIETLYDCYFSERPRITRCEAWLQVNTELAELYPERKDTP